MLRPKRLGKKNNAVADSMARCLYSAAPEDPGDLGIRIDSSANQCQPTREGYKQRHRRQQAELLRPLRCGHDKASSPTGCGCIREPTTARTPTPEPCGPSAAPHASTSCHHRPSALPARVDDMHGALGRQDALVPEVHRLHPPCSSPLKSLPGHGRTTPLTHDGRHFHNSPADNSSRLGFSRAILAHRQHTTALEQASARSFDQPGGSLKPLSARRPAARDRLGSEHWLTFVASCTNPKAIQHACLIKTRWWELD